MSLLRRRRLLNSASSTPMVETIESIVSRLKLFPRASMASKSLDDRSQAGLA